MSSPLVTRSLESTVCGVPTRFELTAYTNRIFVVVTQTAGMGTLILAQKDSPMNASSSCYSTRIILGRRDDEMLEAYARTLVELISKRAPDAGPLMLGVSIKEHSNEVFREVMRVVEENRVW
jgi:hypothetical protein